MHNPFLNDILSLLQSSPGGISEYAIHKALATHEHFNQYGNDHQLSLFKKHFLVMNALYQLKVQLWRDEHRVLSISPLAIKLNPSTEHYPETDVTTEHDSLSAYYLDASNFINTDQADVENLLDDFWRRYIGIDERVNALIELELDEEATSIQIKQRYRKLAAKHHPDRGGNHQNFVRVRLAYETLTKI